MTSVTRPTPLERIRDRFAVGAGWSADDRLWFEERAAIAEYDGGLSRAAAEQLAWQELQSFARP